MKIQTCISHNAVHSCQTSPSPICTGIGCSLPSSSGCSSYSKCAFSLWITNVWWSHIISNVCENKGYSFYSFSSVNALSFENFQNSRRCQKTPPELCLAIQRAMLTLTRSPNRFLCRLWQTMPSLFVDWAIKEKSKKSRIFVGRFWQTLLRW